MLSTALLKTYKGALPRTPGGRVCPVIACWDMAFGRRCRVFGSPSRVTTHFDGAQFLLDIEDARTSDCLSEVVLNRKLYSLFE